MVEFKPDEDIVAISESDLARREKRFKGVVEVSNNNDNCECKKRNCLSPGLSAVYRNPNFW